MYDYLLMKVNKEEGNGTIYDTRFFNNSKQARNEMCKNDILLKCKKDSVFYNGFRWKVSDKDIIKKYHK